MAKVDYGIDNDIGTSELNVTDRVAELDGLDIVKEAIQAIGTTTIVSCPLEPIVIPGVTAAAYTAGDCVGTVLKVAVPKRGVIMSGLLLELSDTGGQYDLEIFKQEYTAIADNDAWSPTDQDMKSFVTELAFVSGDDQDSSYSFELNNIGKAYTAPGGFFYIQCVDRGAKTIAANQIPMVQLQIQSFDPDFKES